jgi:hypothetical protein
MKKKKSKVPIRKQFLQRFEVERWVPLHFGHATF